MAYATSTLDETAEAAQAYPSRRYATLVIAILMIITINSLLDRYLPALLMDPIRQTFQISDSQVSLIQGYAFALFFLIFSLPCGRLVDRTNRRNLLAAGLIVWSVSTALCGFANSVEMLFLARIGVGIGEACLAPAAYSLIADYVPPHYRGRALAIYFISLAAGAGLSLVVGASVLQLLPDEQFVDVPLLGELRPWQFVFLIAGCSGLVIAPLLAIIKEVPRRRADGKRDVAGKTSFREFLTHVANNRSTLVLVFAAYVMIAFAMTCMVSWAPSFYIRTFGIPLATSGFIVGTSLIVGSVVGALCGGMLSDKFLTARRPGLRLRVVLYANAVFLPAAAAWTLVDSVWLSAILFGVAAFGHTMSTAGSSSAIQELAPSSMRGQLMGAYVLVGGLISIGFGPTSVALVTDFVLRDDSLVRFSIILVAVPASVISLIAAWRGLGRYDRLRSHLTVSGQEGARTPPNETPRLARTGSLLET